MAPIIVTSQDALNQIMGNQPKGLQADRGDNTVYAIHQRILSMDEGSDDMRCGMLTMCYPDQRIAISLVQLFANTWNPGTVFADTKANIVGKICYGFEWSGSKTHDITNDKTSVKNVRRIGQVIGSRDILAIILLDKNYVESEYFKTSGFWTKTE